MSRVLRCRRRRGRGRQHAARNVTYGHSPPPPSPPAAARDQTAARSRRRPGLKILSRLASAQLLPPPSWRPIQARGEEGAYIHTPPGHTLPTPPPPRSSPPLSCCWRTVRRRRSKKSHFSRTHILPTTLLHVWLPEKTARGKGRPPPPPSFSSPPSPDIRPRLRSGQCT